MNKDKDTKYDGLNQEDPELVKIVDQMMDPNISDPPKETVNVSDFTKDSTEDRVEPVKANEPPPLDIFANTVTAPLLKPVKTTKESKTKLKIKDANSEGGEVAGVDKVPDEDFQPIETTIAVGNDDQESTVDDQFLDKVGAGLNAIVPDEYDDPKTEKAIKDIVAKESDEVIMAEDSLLAQEEAASEPLKTKKTSHPIFWSLVGLVSLVAIAIIVFLIDPNIHDPISKINWSSIRHHL
jgi:hypothetical protein